MSITYYRQAGQYFASDCPDLPLEKTEPPGENEPLIWLFNRDPQSCRASFCVSDPRQLTNGQENTCFLAPERIPGPPPILPQSLRNRIEKRTLRAVNFRHPQWKRALGDFHASKRKKRIHLLAVGDVGSTLLIGLKLLGGDYISHIGICDLNEKTVARWAAEMGQVSYPGNYDALPCVEAVTPEALFACDIFIFAATKSVPPVGSAVGDVRMAQFSANRPLVESYARQARKEGFRGLFCVLSDPVDPLCRAAYLASNAGKDGVWDGMGLLPEQIRGFGLGVMNARAADLARRTLKYRLFLTEGHAFGSHGQGLVLANSIEHYDDTVSRDLTEEVLKANLRIRDLGFKPYVAPALSSGALQLLLLLRAQWHLSSIPLGNIWFGCYNRLTSAGIETEPLSLPEALFTRIRETEANLAAIF